MQCGDDFPELEFEYEDTESHMNEIAELYSYTEVPEFQTNLRVSHRILCKHVVLILLLDAIKDQLISKCTLAGHRIAKIIVRKVSKLLAKLMYW